MTQSKFALLLVLLILGLFNVCISQNYQPTQLVSMGGALNDFVTHSVIDEEGNIYMTGRFSGVAYFGNDSLLCAGNSDVFLVKMDPNGVIEWATRAGGESYDIGNRLLVTQSAIYLVGTFTNIASFANPYNYGEKQIASLGGSDFFIAKYLKNGTFLWAKRGGGVSDDVGNGIAVSGNQIVVTGGYKYFADFSTPPYLGHQEIESNGGYDCFVAFYDTLGNFKKAITLGGSLDDFGTGVLSDQTHYYLSGTFNDTILFNQNTNDSFQLTSSYSSDVFLAQFSFPDHCIWAQTIGGAGTESVTDLAIFGESVLISGTFSQAAVLTSSQPQQNQSITSKGGLDFYLAKYNHSGVLDWVVSGGGLNEDVSNSLCVTPSEILICGNFSNNMQFHDKEKNPVYNLTSLGFSDIFLASYGYDGAFKWGRRDGSTSIDFGTSVLKFENELLCLGNFNLFTRFGEENGTYLDVVAKGGIDIFLTKYSLEGNGINDILFKIFPNPCFTHLNVVVDPSFLGEEFGTYDIAGKCFSYGKISSISFFVDVSSYAAGVYIFKTSKKRMKGIQFIKL